MRLITSSETHANILAETFSEGFVDDPFYEWMFPETDTRAQRLRDYFEAKIARAIESERTALITSDSGNAVMIVTDAAASAGPTEPQLPLPSTPAPDAHADRVSAVLAHIPYLPRPHLYLDVIATSIRSRGRGEGSRLMTEWLERRPLPTVHLHSSNPANLSFYGRLGFVAAGPLPLPYGAPPVTPMTLSTEA